jgi:signal transduction histidine kinase/CheY-like chemotaxis protein
LGFVVFILCRLLLTIRAANDGASFPGFPVIRSYSHTEVGVDTSGFGITEDSDGTLLFGCHVLVSFDGERWRTTSVEGAYGFKMVEFDSQHRLWLAAVGNIGWFDRLEKQWIFHSLRKEFESMGPSPGEIWGVYPDEFGTTFIATNAILRWKGDHFESWSMPDTRRLLGMRLNGKTYIHYVREGHGLYRMEADGPALFIPQSVLGDRAVLWMTARGEDLLMATSRGLFLYRDGRLIPFAPRVSELLNRDLVIKGIVLPDGRLAFGTYRGGIVLMRPNGDLDRVLGEPEGMPSNYIRDLFVDGQGLWATTSSHIVRIDLQGSTDVFDHRSKLAEQGYYAISPLNELIILGAQNGVYSLSPGASDAQVFHELRERFNEIRSEGSELILSGFHGVRYIRDGNLGEIFRNTSDATATTRSRSHPDELFIALSTQQIIAATPDGRSRLVVNKLPVSTPQLAEDDAGNLWIGTAINGFFVATPKDGEVVDASIVSSATGLPQEEGQTFVKATSDGGIFAFSKQAGWWKAPGKKRFEPILRYPQRSISAVSNAVGNAIWIAHPNSSRMAPALARVKTDGEHALWEPHSAVGLEAAGEPASIYAEENSNHSTTLWIGGTKAVIHHLVKNGPEAPRPRPPLLNALARVADEEHPRAVAGELPYSTRSIQFEFAEPDFARRAQLHLETRIDGIDRDWVPGGPESKRELTAVREGHYTFHVRALAETGVASETTTLAFTIAPPWWRTAPAMLGAVFALMPIGYGAYALRLRTLRRRNAELEEKVRERTEELEQANAAKTEFVANMSHDIRNPLNGIVGLALALEDTKLDQQQREMVSTLRECTTYLSSLVDDVLDFASIEAGRVELRPGPFVPGELLRSVATAMRGQLAEHSASLAVEVDPALPPSISGDAGRIQQILVNYVSNALKYAGGEIRLSATVAFDSPDEVEFSVSDKGPGITEAEQAALFTKFTRLAGARQHEIPGAGLGLASCRLLADIMGGSVGIVSKVGQGSRFLLRLPLTAAETPAPVEANKLPNTTVLLVEDTDYNAIAATAVLHRLGLTCERAATGTEALRLFGAKRFNLVLLDRNLPDMDGIEVARRMRAMESDGLQAIVLAVTAYCTAEDRKLCLDAGMDAFVGKPLTPEKLRKVLISAAHRLLASATVDASEDTAAKSLDTSLLDYLSDGTTQGLETQIARFLSHLTEAEKDLAQLGAARDWPALALSAHRLVGQAKMVGASALAEAALRLEESAREGDATACASLGEQVSGEIKNVTEALRRRRSAVLTS